VTDADLEKRLAEIEGWTATPNMGAAVGFLLRSPKGETDWCTIYGTREQALSRACEYLTDANAVLRVLEKWPHGFEWGKYQSGVAAKGEEYYCILSATGARDGKFHRGKGPTLCRAACLAIVNAQEGKQA
jgi:hypothetical protein